MKKISFIIILIFSSYSLVFCQIRENRKQLKIINIAELNGVYVIDGISENTDTLKILSPKEKVKKKCNYDKIKKGATYIFELKESPAYTSNLIIRCNGIIFWKTGDDPKKMPFFANNVKDIFIKDNE